MYGQGTRITELTEATSADDNSLLMVREGETGNVIKKISIANLMKDRTLTGTITLPAATSIGDVSSTELGYVNGVTSAIQTQIDEKETRIDSLVAVLADSVSVSEVAPLLADTSLYFSWTIGVGNAGDTIAFSYGDIPCGGLWEGSHTLVITKVTAVVHGTTPDIDIALLSDVNFRDATPTEVFSSDLTVTSTTTGDDATINTSNDEIASGTWLWFRIDQCAAQPTQAIFNIYGYLLE